jgi:small-conductance mechanosensitive channel
LNLNEGRLFVSGFSTSNPMNILNPRQVKRKTNTSASGNAFWVWTFGVLAAASLAIYLLLDLQLFQGLGTYLGVLKKLALLSAIGFAILSASRIIEGAVPAKNPAARYNLIRLIRLLDVVIIIGVGISLLFENWYTAAVSLGLISLLVGFALQTPITSLIGWLYIVIRTPYHVGERIQIEDFKGDVVEISYLDTTLWEFGGSYLTNDLPSGRLIRFPNSLVLQSAIFNYSWSKFPYLWNEIPFHVAYECDLPFVEETIKRVTKQELDQTTDDKIRELKEYMSQTPVSEIDIQAYPLVSLRINTNTWVEASVTYLVDPKKAAATRTRIIQSVLAELLRNPDRVLFPKSNAR